MKLHPNAPTALALALALLASGASQALTVVTQFGLPLGKGFPVQSGQLSYFDASLGTLTGASLTVFAASELAFSVFNPSLNNAAVGSVSAQVRGDFGSTEAALNNPLLAASEDLVFGLSAGYTLPPQAAQLVLATGNSLRTFDLAPYLSSLDGTGTFSLRSTWTQDSLANVGNGVTFSTSGANYGFGSILTYTYSALPAVPEPGAWVLMALGMATLGTLRRYWHRRGPNTTAA